MTKGEVLKKYGMRILQTDLDEEDTDGEFEKFISKMQEFHKEIEENIEKYCTKCRYNGDTTKCDSWIHGASEGVSCKYIGKAKGEDMNEYNERKIMRL